MYFKSALILTESKYIFREKAQEIYLLQLLVELNIKQDKL